MRNYLIVFLLFVSCNLMAQTTTYTVDPAGNGTHTTIQAAFDAVNNSVLTTNTAISIVPGTYDEALILKDITVSPGKKFRIYASTNKPADVVIRNSLVPVNFGSVLTISNVNRVLIMQLTFASETIKHQLIGLGDSCLDVFLLNLTFVNNRVNKAEQHAIGSAVDLTAFNQLNMGAIEVHGCRFDSISPYQNLFNLFSPLTARPTKLGFQNNFIRGQNKTFWDADTLHIINNKYTDCTIGGILGFDSMLVARNKVTTDYGQFSVFPIDEVKGSGLIAYNNFISSNDDNMVVSSDKKSLKIINNSFTTSGREVSCLGITESDSLYIYNNIFQALGTDARGIAFFDSAYKSADVFEADHNCYYSPDGNPWKQVNQLTNFSFADVKALGYEANGLNTDPLFDTSQLYASSAALVDAGKEFYIEELIPFLTIKNKPDIGAYEIFRIADLTVKNITSIVGILEGGKTVSVNYDLFNTQPKMIRQFWKDEVYLSIDSVYDTSDYLIGERQQTYISLHQKMDGMQTSVQIPFVPAGQYYFIIRTNVDSITFENDFANNTNYAGPYTIVYPDLADVYVDSIITPSSQFSGKSFDLIYTIKNKGVAVTTGPWMDYVYAANDPALLNRPSNLINDSLLLVKRPNVQALGAGGSYRNSVSVNVPLRYSGKIYYRVQSNAGKSIFEQDTTYAANGKNSNAVNITQTPLPDLQMGSLSVPSTAFSGSKVPVSWIVRNVGKQSTYRTEKELVNRRATIAVPKPSHWFDAVFMSRKPYYDVSEKSQRLLVSYYGNAELGVDQQYTVADSISFESCDYGKYYLFAVSNVDGYTYELSFNNNISVVDSIEVIIDPMPDMVPTNVQLANSPVSGRNIRIEYTVLNDGFSDKPNWKSAEAFYLSRSDTFDAEKSLYLGVAYEEDALVKGSSSSGTIDFKLPYDAFGDFYIYYFTDRSDNICEANKEDNNMLRSSSTIEIVLGEQPDLIPTLITPLDTLIAGNSYPVIFEIGNIGRADAEEAKWVDELSFGGKPQYRSLPRTPLAQGASYLDTTYVKIPLLQEEGNATLRIWTDAGTEVFEYQLEDNNKLDQEVYIKRDLDKAPDIEVVSMNLLKDSFTFGEQLELEYTLVNRSAAISNQFWKNRIEVLLEDEVLFTEEFTHRGAVSSSSSVHSAKLDLPYEYASDEYTVRLIVDCDLSLNEYFTENNTAEAQTSIGKIIAPDLLVSQLIYAGDQTYNALETVELALTVRDLGLVRLGLEEVGFKVYMSKDRQGSNPVNVFFFRGKIRTKFTGMHILKIPYKMSYDLSGDYFTICEIDYDNKIYEDTSETNNIYASFSTISVDNKPMEISPSSIDVKSATNPFSDFLKVAYTVTKTSTDSLNRKIQDQLILSEDREVDAADYRFAYLREGKSRVLSSSTSVYNDSFAFSLPNDITPGWYYVGVLFDAQNSVLQTREDQNGLFTMDSFYIDFTIPLVLDQAKQGYFYEGTIRSRDVYTVSRPTDKGMLVTLDFDHDEVSSEMYHRIAEVPNRTQYDTKYDNPFLADQQMVVSVTDSAVTDYINVIGAQVPWNRSEAVNFDCYRNSQTWYSGSGGVSIIGGDCDKPEKSNYTLLAESKTYSLHSVYPDSGSYYGTTSVGIQGFDFEEGMDVFLVKDKDTLRTNYTDYIDQTNLAAHFDLRGATAGKYDLIASNLNGQLTRLEQGFTVYEGPTVIPFTSVNSVTSSQLVNQQSTVTVEFGNRAHSNGYDYWLLVAFANQSFDPQNLRTQYIGSSEEDMYDKLEEHINPPLDSAFVDIDGMRYYAYWVPVLPAKSQTTFTYNFSNTAEEYTLVQAQLIERPLNEFTFAQDRSAFTRSATLLEIINDVIEDGEALKPKTGKFDCENIDIAEVQKELLTQTWAVAQSVNAGTKTYTGVRSFKDVINKTLTARATELKSAVDVKGKLKEGAENTGNLTKLALTRDKSGFQRMGEYAKSVLDGADPIANLKKLAKPKKPPFADIITNVFGCLDEDEVAQNLSNCMVHRRKLNKYTREMEEVSEMSQACKEKYGFAPKQKQASWREKIVRFVGSFDPNEIVGPEGSGTLRSVSPGEKMDYTIHFENLSSASAPARFVAIDNPLDSNFRLQNFYLTSFGFGDTVIQIEPTNALNITIPLGKKYNFKNLNLVAGIDVISKRAIWRFSTVEPSTGALVMSPFDGFLPPNDTTNIGQGFVTYTISSESNVASGTEITNQADIVFDGNAVISTNVWSNMIVNETVGSTVAALPPKSDSTFTVSWASDAGANATGVKLYTIYVAKENAPYSRWITASAAGSAEYTGRSGETYRFYSEVETTNGELEVGPQDYDAITTTKGTVGMEGLLDDHARNSYLVAYPNPTQGMVNFKYLSKDEITLSIISIDGKILREVVLGPALVEKNIQTNLNDLKAGMYVVKAVSVSGTSHVRIIKE